MKSLAAFSSLATLTLAASQFDTSSYNPSDIITRDVAVIGGGSSGTFGAFKLKDRGKSVVVIESQGQLGGHIEIYTDPATGATLDYGVHEFWNISLFTDFFARFNVPIEDFVFLPNLPSTPISRPVRCSPTSLWDPISLRILSSWTDTRIWLTDGI